jgi:hypothetical protein
MILFLYERRKYAPRLLWGHGKRIEKLLKLKKEAERDGAYRIAKRIHAVVLNMEGYTI